MCVTGVSRVCHGDGPFDTCDTGVTRGRSFCHKIVPDDSPVCHRDGPFVTTVTRGRSFCHKIAPDDTQIVPDDSQIAPGDSQNRPRGTHIKGECSFVAESHWRFTEPFTTVLLRLTELSQLSIPSPRDQHLHQLLILLILLKRGTYGID